MAWTCFLTSRPRRFICEGCFVKSSKRKSAGQAAEVPNHFIPMTTPTPTCIPIECIFSCGAFSLDADECDPDEYYCWGQGKPRAKDGSLPNGFLNCYYCERTWQMRTRHEHASRKAYFETVKTDVRAKEKHIVEKKAYVERLKTGAREKRRQGFVRNTDAKKARVTTKLE